MNYECINTSLLFAIDCGSTLVTSHTPYSSGLHKRTLIGVEMGRLPYIYDIAVANGMPDCGIEAVTPEFFGDLDISATHTLDTCNNEIIRRASYYAIRDDTWPHEMVEAEKTYSAQLRAAWCFDWSCSYATKYAEVVHRFFTIYYRYAAYMMLEVGEDPLHISDILFPVPWTEEFPEDDMVRRYGRDLAARYPPIMKAIENFFLPQVAIDRAVKPLKRSRNRGTVWDIADLQLSNDEVSTLRRSLALPSLTPVARDVMESLEQHIDQVVVETRQRGQNVMKHVKSETNQRRSNAPVLRYGHPLVTRDVLDTVLNLQGKKENVYGEKAATRVTMVCCLLYLHSIPVDMWVHSSTFPRPPKRT